jgi:hypothetical protein
MVSFKRFSKISISFLFLLSTLSQANLTSKDLAKSNKTIELIGLFLILENESSSELLSTINVINKPICFIQISNDSVAIGFIIPIIRVWNIKTKAELCQLFGHRDQVNKLKIF